MTDLATRPTNGWGLTTHQLHEPTLAPTQAVEPVPAQAVVRLADWAAEARAAASIATSVCKTSFVPEHFRGRPEEATAAILTGHEMGLSPMAALRAIYVIKGTPAMYAHAMRAVVQAQGHEIWVKEATSTRVIVCGRRRGSAEVQQSTWTIDRAQKAGLMGNQQYTKNPQNMLTARATAEVCRLIASDALHGIPYAVEELDTAVDAAPAEEIKPARRTARRASAKPAPEPAPEPELTEPDPIPEPPVEVEPDEPAAVAAEPEPGITDAQKTKLHAAFTGAGIKGRDQKIAEIERIIGRRVGSSTELTKREAMRVIDHLEGMALPVDEPVFDDWPDVTQPGGAR